MIEIRSKSRVHCGLISLHQEGYRRFGGVGFSLDYPESLVRVDKISTKHSIEIKDERDFKSSIQEISKLRSIVQDVLIKFEIDSGVSISISGELIPHVGLGAGTSTTLSTVEAVLALHSYETEKQRLQLLSKRGGTSGIGVESYFSGGCVLDLGHKNENSSWLPSSKQSGNSLPIILSRSEMPPWKIRVFTPSFDKGCFGKEEVNLFSDYLPMSYNESLYNCYHTIFGVYASIVENDLDGFIKAIKKIQQSKWKRMEISQHSKLIDFISYVNSKDDVVVGMSSMGPSLFLVGKGQDDIEPPDGFVSKSVLPCNTGRSIKYV